MIKDSDKQSYKYSKEEERAIDDFFNSLEIPDANNFDILNLKLF